MNQEEYDIARNVQRRVDFLLNHGDGIVFRKLAIAVNKELKEFLQRELEKDSPLSEYFGEITL